MSSEPVPVPTSGPPDPARAGLRTPWAWMPSATATLLAFFLVWGFLRPIDWDDLGWHIRIGNWILEHRAIPWTNILVWTTPEHPFVPHEWLSEVVFALLDRAGGMRALLVTRSVVFAGMLFLLVDLGRRARAEPLSLAALLFVAGWGLGTQATLRPWLFSNFLLVLQLWLVERTIAERRTRLLWFLPPLYLLWANLHGGFVVGLAVLAARLADRVWAAPAVARREVAMTFAPAVGASVLAACLTPHGPAHLLFPLRYLFAEEDGTGIRLMKQAITEWLPIRFDSIDGGVWIALAAGLVLALVVSRETRRDARAWLALALLALCLRETRHLAWATAIAFGPLAAGLLAPFAVRVRAAPRGFLARVAAHARLESLPRPGFAAVVLASVLVLYATYARGPGFERAVTQPDRYPFDAFAAVERLEANRLFHFYEYCGPIAWKMPGQRLFVVGIHDAQPESLFSDYLRLVHRLDDWPETLARWSPDVALLPAGHPLVAELQARGWGTDFEDEFATVLTAP